MRSSQTSHLGRVDEASAKAVVATDSVSADADCDNGKRRLPCRGMRRPEACRRGALVAREAREEAKSVEQSARPGRTSFFGSSRLGNGADLLHQAKLVLDGPRLGDLAFLYAVEGDAREFHLLAGRSDAHIFPLMGGAAPPASHHHVSFSYEVLNGAYHVREALPEICCLLLSSLGLPGCIEFLCCVEIPGMVPEFFLLPTYHGFVLFRRHLRLLLPEVRFPLADHNTWCMVPLEDIRCTLALSPTERSARKRRQEWNSYRLLVGGSQLDTRWERQPACGAIGTFNEGHHRSAQGPVDPLPCPLLPDAARERVAEHELPIRYGCRRRCNLLGALLCDLLVGDSLGELTDPKPTRVPGGAVGRQDVVGSYGLVRVGHCRVFPEKKRTVVSQAFEEPVGVFGLHL